jgi:CRP-like cAMP-binding protein
MQNGDRCPAGQAGENPTTMREEDTAQLRRHWLFAGTPSDSLAPMAARSRVVRFVAGEEIFAEGDDPDGLYLIVAGAVRIQARGAGGEVLLAMLGPNELFGEMGVLDGERRSGNAEAVERSTLFFVPAEAFEELASQSSALCVRLLVLLANRLRAMNGRLADLPVQEPTDAAEALREFRQDRTLGNTSLRELIDEGRK